MKIEAEAGEGQEEKRTTPTSAAAESAAAVAAGSESSASSLSLSQFPSAPSVGRDTGTTAAATSTATSESREQDRGSSSSNREGGALLEVRDATTRTIKMEQPEQERQNQTTKENSNPDSNNASLGNSPPGKASSPLSAPPSNDKSARSDGGPASKRTPKPPSTPSRTDPDGRQSSDRSPSSSSKQVQSPSRRQRSDPGGRGSATLTPPRSSGSSASSYRPPPYSDAGSYHHHGMPHHPLSGPGPGPPPPPPHGASAGAHPHPPPPSYHPYYGQHGDHPPPPYAAAPAPGGGYAPPPYQSASRYPPPPGTYGGQGGPPPPPHHYHHSHQHPPPAGRAYPPPSHAPPPPHHPYSHHHYGGAPPPPSHPYGPPSSSTPAGPYHHPGQGGGPSMHYGGGPPPPPPHGDHHSSSHGEHPGGSQPPTGPPPSSASSQSSSTYHHREPSGTSHPHSSSSYSSSARSIGPSGKDDSGGGRNIDSRNSGRGTGASAGAPSSGSSGYSRKRSLDGYRGISTDSSGRSSPPHPPSSSGTSSKSAFAAVHHRSGRSSSRHQRSGSSNSSSTSSTASTITARNGAGDGGGGGGGSAMEGSSSRVSSAPPPHHHDRVAGDHRGGEISSASSSTTASPVFRPKSSGAPVPSSSRVRASPGSSHRRLHSTSSTSSSLSVGGLSMSSYDGRGHDKHGSSAGPMIEASPKRKRSQQESMDQGEDDDTSGTPKRGNFSSDHTYHEGGSGHGRQPVARSVDRFSHRRGHRTSSRDDDDRSAHPAAPMDRSASSAPPPGTSPSHRRELTIDSTSSGNRDAGIFLTLSTSPINCVIDEVTQGSSSNTDRESGDVLADSSIEVSIEQTGAANRSDEGGSSSKSSAPRDSPSLQYMSEKRDGTLPEPKSSDMELSALPYQRQNNSSFDSAGSAPSSSPLGGMVPSGDVTTEEHSLNRHLRGQSFTPLPHVVTSGEGERDGQNATSPTFNPGLSSIAPQLSWSIAGDTPPLGEIADWAEQQRQKREPPSPSAGPGHRRHGSNTSLERATGGSDRRSRGGPDASTSAATSSPHSPSPMIFWRDDAASNRDRHAGSSTASRSRQHTESMSPSSDVAMEEVLGGQTTPLPVFFEEKGQDDEGMRDDPHEHPARTPGRQRSRSHHRYHDEYRAEAPRRSSPSEWESGRRSEPPSSGPEMFAHDDDGPGGHHRKLPKPQATKLGAVRADGIPSWSDDGYSPSSPGMARRDDPGRYSYRPDGRPHMRDYRSEGKRIQGEDQRDDAYNMGYPGRESREGPPPDYHRPATVYSAPYDPHGRDAVMGTPGDRVRNLRGRGPPPSGHHPPPPIHIPPMSSPHHHHHPLTSPMAPVMPKSGGPGTGGMWGHQHSHHPHPHIRSGGPPGMMMPGLDMAPSKRKCVPLKPPIPSKFQGDIEKVKSAQVPEFTSLVNFPVHMSQKQAMNLPEGMRCCVMCGQPCPCSTAKNKKGGPKVAGGSHPDSVAPLGSHGQGGVGGGSMYQPGSGPGGPGGSAYAIIPTQNKGLCTMCDVNVWVVTASGLEIKWCKGCKNFRPWAAFGDKGLATKCVRCRERQREKYAAQKEEKEKARLGSAKSNSGSSTGSSSAKGTARS